MGADSLEVARQSFEKALMGRGIVIPSGGVIADGRIHRTRVDGKRSKDGASYRMYDDPPYAGWFENHCDGIGVEKWVYSNGFHRDLSSEEYREQVKRWEEKRRKREAEELEEQIQATAKAREAWENAQPAPADHTYLVKKQILPNVLRVTDRGNLLVPMVDEFGVIQNVQAIAPDGSKKFQLGAKAKGLFFEICLSGNPSPGTVVICEGSATGLSIFEATGYPVISALSSVNLPSVAVKIRKKYPDADLIFFADNDESGTGIRKAREAAGAVGGSMCISPIVGEDANDVYVRSGKQALLDLISSAQKVDPPAGEEPTKPSSAAADTDGEKEPAGTSMLPRFPDPPEEAAYHGLAGDFIRLVEPQTEGDPVAMLAQFLVMYGNMIGRGPYVAIGADRHYTNLFLAAVGVTSKGRKGVGSGEAKRPLKMVDDEWGLNRIKGGLSSGEGLIWEVRDPIEKQEPIKDKGRVSGYQMVQVDPGQADKRLMVLEPELVSALRVLPREGNTLSSQIRQAWDSGNLRVLTKNNPAQATDAHISIIGHITKQELLRYLDATEMGNGFANRFMWVCSKRSKFLPRGGSLRDADFASIVRKLADATDFARRVGEAPITWDEEGGAYWDSIYPRLSSGGFGMAGAVTGRAEPIVLRLSLIYALLDRAERIGRLHVQAAHALWAYCDASVKYIFGDKTGDPVADNILDALQKAGKKGMTRTEIRDHFGRNMHTKDILRGLQTLLENGAARFDPEKDTGGRPVERWFSTTPGQIFDEEADCA